jgi:flavodoxin I
MPDIGLFFGSSTGNSENVARMIAKSFLPTKVCIHDILEEKSISVVEYTYLIFGIPSWNKHHLQDDWFYFLPKLTDIDFSTKTIALYGLGDQMKYPENFLEGMARIYDWFIERNVKIVGDWPVTGYRFRKSQAVRNGKFVGLALDEDTQYNLTLPRVKIWVKNLKKEFEITN